MADRHVALHRRRCRRTVRVQRRNLRGAVRRKRIALMLGAVVPLAACASGSSNSPGEGPIASTASTTTVTQAPVSSSSTPVLTSPSTSTSTTLDLAAEAVPQVRTAVDLAQQTFSACLVAMPSCDPSVLSLARAGDLLARNVARISEWNAAGYTVRNRDQYRYVIEEVTLAPGGSQATALVCVADGSDLVKPGAGPGDADVIIDDSFTAGRESWDMRLEPDGKWRAYDAPAVGPTEATDVCPSG